MKKRKLILISILLIVIISSIGIYFFLIKKDNVNMEEELIPEEEISSEQLRKTIVTLYFVDKNTNEIVPEAKLIDVKEMINLPYEKLIKLIIDGSENENFKTIIPEGTEVNKIYMEDNCIVIDFSEQLLNYNKEGINEKNNIINTLLYTLTELVEIDSMKILINGDEHEDFSEIYRR